MRLSIETYPGIRRSYVILPAALTGHGMVIVWFVLTRFPYDRIGLAGGFLLHVVLALFSLHLRRAAGCAGGSRSCRSATIEPLQKSTASTGDHVEAPRLHDTRGCTCDRRRLQRRAARRMGSLPGRRRARRADRLPGQAIVGIADRPGRARASFRKQLRLAASGAGLFLPEGPRAISCSRCCCFRSSLP